MPGSGGVVVRQPDQSENPPGSGAQRMVPGRVPLPVWRWGVLDSFLAALCNGPSASFLSAFAVELGAGGGILGLLLALNTFLANGLQLQGAAWARRGSSVRRVYGAAIVARGTWLVAGTIPAAIYAAGYPAVALSIFVALLGISSIASAAANPAMGARASTAGGEGGRTRYLADRAIATWVGILVGTAGMTLLLGAVPGVWGYAIGFVIAALAGLGGLRAYAGLVATDRRIATDRRAVDEPATRAGPTPSTSLSQASGPLRRPPGPEPTGGVWGLISRRLGAPQSAALGTIVIGAAILQGGASMIGPASPIWLVKHLGMPASYLGALSLVSSLAAIASQRIWARYIDRQGSRRVLGVAGALAAVVPLGWLVVFDPWVAVPLNLFAGLSWGGYSLAMSARLLQLAPAADRPAYLGTYAAAIGISGAFGSLIAGAVAAAVPIEWVPAIFVASFATRGLGWWAMRGGPTGA